MDVRKFRDMDLKTVCLLLGLEPDKNDKNQFLGGSHRISINGSKFYDHNNNVGGGGAIDLVMVVNGVSFLGVIDYLNTIDGNVTHTVGVGVESVIRVGVIPTINFNNLQRVIDYLTVKRGLNIDLVSWCIDKGIIYADDRANCVFKYGVLGAELRGTSSIKWRGVCGKINHGFILPAKNATGIAVCESAIDALSYRQVNREHITVSIAGDGNKLVISQTVTIAADKGLPLFSAFDNDKGGDIANTLLTNTANQRNITVIQNRPPNDKKDWNDYVNC